LALRKKGSVILTSKRLELDEQHIDAIINLADEEIALLNVKIAEAVKDSYCKYETMDKLSNRRNGLVALIDLLKDNT
tara:strand:+ start:67 stop:297 length:231 start_codon:yes stop_codon:yes gene_type:complete